MDREVGAMRKAVVALLAMALTIPGIAGVARAEDPPFVDWTSLLPGLSSGFDPASDNLCTSGKEQCVHAVIKEMTKRFNKLANTCDHDAIFSLTYLRTTEEYHRFWHEGHFREDRWLNYYDAVFGSYYFDAIDNWNQGRYADVPEAWRIAFDASDDKSVSGSGSIFLGMSAHINRDLPFVIASIGMTDADGSSRKPDHDTVNQFLNRVSDTLFGELARRFDPTVDDSQVPGTFLDDLGSFQVVPAWREQAWRNAERLVAAQSEAERAQVAADIESFAAAEANAIKAATAYNALSSFKASDRDAYCALNHNQA